MNRQILHIALPSIIANITTPLLGMVDMAIVGHMGDPVFIAAISLGGIIFSMIYWIFGFLRMGTSGLTAQAYGADDLPRRDAVLQLALTLAVAIGIIFIILHKPLLRLMLHFLGADNETNLLASQYFNILIYGAPATLATYAFNGWFIGMQNSRAAMWTSLIINVVNIAASLTLVYALRLGISGVASGTLIAQWAGMIAAAAFCRKYQVKLRGFPAAVAHQPIGRFFSVNRDIFLRTLCLVAVTVWFTRAGARQGDLVLAVNALLMQLFLLFSYIMDGFAFSAEAIMGKISGRHSISSAPDIEKKEKLSALKALFSIGIIIAATFTAIYAFGGDVILKLLSDDPKVISLSADYRMWAVTIPFVSFGAFIWDGVFIGETLTRYMLIDMFAAMTVFFITYFSLFHLLGNHALWLAFIFYLGARAIIQSLLYRHHIQLLSEPKK